METTKDRINRALGLMGAKSVDEMIDDLEIDAKGDIDQLSDIEGKMEKSFELIDKKAQDITRAESGGVLEISDMNDSLKEIEGLIKEARDIFFHIKESIMSSSILDSELVESSAKLLESIHVNINEFVSVYRAKQKFVEKVKLMIFAQEQKKEIMELKHRHDMELAEAKKKDSQPESVDADAISFNTDDIIKRLQHDEQPVNFGPDGVPADSDDRLDEIEKLGGVRDRKNPFDR